jgi:hypothetical protein
VLWLPFATFAGEKMPTIVQISGHTAASKTDGTNVGPAVSRALGYVVESEGFLLTNTISLK